VKKIQLRERREEQQDAQELLQESFGWNHCEDAKLDSASSVSPSLFVLHP
jgi:hypothetical protein